MNMNLFFFTFGSDEKYPFKSTEFVMVVADTEHEACEKFTAKYPKRIGSDCVNCAFVYTKEQFKNVWEKYYNGVRPAEILK